MLTEFILSSLHRLHIPQNIQLIVRTRNGERIQMSIRNLLDSLALLSKRKQQRIRKFVEENAHDRLAMLRCLRHLATPLTEVRV